MRQITFDVFVRTKFLHNCVTIFTPCHFSAVFSKKSDPFSSKTTKFNLLLGGFALLIRVVKRWVP